MISARLYTKDEIKSVQTTDDNAIGNGKKTVSTFLCLFAFLKDRQSSI